MNAEHLAQLRGLRSAMKVIVEGTRCDYCGGYTVAVNDAAFEQGVRMRRLEPFCSCDAAALVGEESDSTDPLVDSGSE